MFERVDAYAGDPIFALMDAFIKDPRKDKVNLTIGFYFDEKGKVPNFGAVDQAKAWSFENPLPSPVYLPMEGLEPFRKAVQHVAFGSEIGNIENRLATIQSLGGSGALKVGADFIKRYFPESAIWVSDPTWENHISIFKGAGFEVNKYRYYDETTKGLDFDGMVSDLSQLPAQSVVLLHPCCHNPTGIDLNEAQWRKVLDVVSDRRLLPFFDMAYQGFGTDLETDSFAIKLMANANQPFLLSQSFSKILSLYNERVGALTVACGNELEAKTVEGQLKFTVRTNYSTPPVHGARVANKVLSDSDLTSLWHSELAAMTKRMNEMRAMLVEKLVALRPDCDFNYLASQKGMFSYTGLNSQQVEVLKNDHGIYLINSGRMCIAGLNTNNIDAVAAAIAAVY